MFEDNETASQDLALKSGQWVYDATGREIGRTQAITDLGIEVDTHSDVETLSLRRAPNANLGEGYLRWWCDACGELGDVEQTPDRCPSCGGGREGLYAYLED